MPKLERWLVVSKTMEILDSEAHNTLLDQNVQLGGGWNRIHQHICVNSNNKEEIEEYLISRGFDIHASTDRTFFHPEEAEKSFNASSEAVEKVQEYDREHWEIGKSFKRLTSQAPNDLLSDSLVTIVTQNAEQIAQVWLDEVRGNRTTPSYRNADSNDLKEKVTTAVTLFGRWLEGFYTEPEVSDFHLNVGKSRKAAGVESH